MKKKLFRNFIFNEKFESTALTIIIGITVGILTVSFILWVRVFRQIFPREIVGDTFSIKFWVIVTLFTYFSLLLVLSIRKSYKLFFCLPLEIKNKFIKNFIESLPEKFPKIYKTLFFISAYILDAPLFLWRYLYINRYLYSNNFIILSALYYFGYYFFLGSWFNRFNRSIVTMWTILFFYSPRILMCLILLFEVCFKQEIILFYTYAIILLIPLIFSALRRMLFEMALFEMERLEDDYLDVTVDERYIHVCPKDPKNTEESLKLVIQSYFNMRDLKIKMIKFFDFGDKYDAFVWSIIFTLLTITFFIWLQKFN